jgi:hypothetical protein
MTPPIRIATHNQYQQHNSFALNYDKYLDTMPPPSSATTNHFNGHHPNNESIKLVTKIRKIKENLDNNSSQFSSNSANQWLQHQQQQLPLPPPAFTSTYNNFSYNAATSDEASTTPLPNASTNTTYNSYLTNSYLTNKYFMLNNSKQQHFDFKLNSSNMTSLDNIAALDQFQNEPSSVRSSNGSSVGKLSASGNGEISQQQPKSKSNKFIPIINNYEFNSHSLKPRKNGASENNGHHESNGKKVIIKGDHSSNNLLLKTVNQTTAQVSQPVIIHQNPVVTYKNAVYTDNVSRQSSIRSLVSNNNNNTNTNSSSATLQNGNNKTVDQTAANMSNFAKIKQTKSKASNSTTDLESVYQSNELDLLNDWDAVGGEPLPPPPLPTSSQPLSHHNRTGSCNSNGSNGLRPRARMGFQPTSNIDSPSRTTLSGEEFYSSNHNFSSPLTATALQAQNGHGHLKFESVKIIKPQPVYVVNNGVDGTILKSETNTPTTSGTTTSTGGFVTGGVKHYNNFANLSAHRNERNNILNSFGKPVASGGRSSSNTSYNVGRVVMENGGSSSYNNHETESNVSDMFTNNMRFEENGNGLRSSGDGGKQFNGFHDIKSNGL